MIVNKTFWEGLPADIRTQLEKAMAEATDYANSIAQEENDKALQAMKDSGKTEFHNLTDDERTKWVEALKAVYEVAAARTGPGIIEAMQKAVAGN